MADFFWCAWRTLDFLEGVCFLQIFADMDAVPLRQMDLTFSVDPPRKTEPQHADEDQEHHHAAVQPPHKGEEQDRDQQISAPDGISLWGVMSARWPSASSAHKIIPSDKIPASFAGFRFVSTITFLPTISSGV